MINLYLSKFGSQSLRGSGDISFFICHVTSCGHVISGSRDFAGCAPSASLTNLPSVVAISLVEVEIWSILLFNGRRRICKIILLQSVTMQFCRLFWPFSYRKLRQSNLFQSVTDFYYKVRQMLQSDKSIKL